MLPAPCSERWKPLRAGIVDLFYYDAEEFWFHDGRLLLRGNNGTGKSKVLALILPFLLDGELRPERVEPDGDRQKRMEWNLLLGGKHPHPERLGYSWLEFGRLSEDGTAEFRTIGCGLKAVAGRGIVRHWFFVTSQRVGPDLRLLPETRVPLTREKLREEVEGHGLVYDRASDYRRAVDEALFGLGEHRYEALINLLIQVRQPQLSKKPDEKLMSRALSEALPPLDVALVTTVAEAFRGLDEERDALTALKEAQTAAEQFLHHYRRYATIAAKRKAAGPRLAHSRYEHLGRDLNEAEEAYAAAERELNSAERELTELEERRTTLEARRRALQESPEMRDAERLEQMRDEAGRRDKTATLRETDRDRLTGDVQRREQQAQTAARRADEAQVKLDGVRHEAETTADAARRGDAHRQAVTEWEQDLPRARRGTEEIAERQGHAVARMEELLAEATRRRQALIRAQEETDRLTAEIQAATEQVAAAERGAADRAAELADAYRGWLHGLVELRISGHDELVESLIGWAAAGDGPNPAAGMVDDAARATGAELGRQEERLSAQRIGHTQHATELETEIGRLRSGGHDIPPTPHTREAGVRDGRPGAPLWKVIDFAPGLDEPERAGLEAALEASGILDAWVTPAGELVLGDVVLVSGAAPVDGPSCASVLVPAVNADDPMASALTEGSVRVVMEAIGLGGGGAAWIDTDGRWANGVLAGAWSKDGAAYIGEGSREAARRERIARLSSELGDVRALIAEADAALAELKVRRARLDAEHRALPSDAGVRDAHTIVAQQRRSRETLRARLADAEDQQTLRASELGEAVVRAGDFAADTGLPSDEAELAAVKEGVAAYRLALAALWPAAEAFQLAEHAAREAAAELTAVRHRLTETAELAAMARQEAAEAAAIYRALKETAGQAVDELFRQLEEVRRDLELRSAAERSARNQEREALEARGSADGRRTTLRTEIEEAIRVRDLAVVEFQSFAATGLLRVALPDMEIPSLDEPWAASPAVVLARSVNADLEPVDDGDGPWDRVQKKVSEEHKLLSDAMMRHGHSAGLAVRDGVMVVDVVFQGRSHDVPGLAAALGEEADQRARLLSAREREILENHLLNEVAGTMHELITAAEAEVTEMNAELSSRPTSTGMKLRLIWQPVRDAPEGFDRVRGKLRQTVDAWSAADREAVGSFLQSRINFEHANHPEAGWTEALTLALDYRRWHEFVVQRYQDGQWRPAVGPASGGERALVASVPLFAAASSHYKSAGNPHAPRLIALDEAFAGVDDDSRAKCLGLLATFDMDVVMTSEREWGCYPQVPGLAICQLARHDGVDAVLVTPWRWDGHERRRADVA
ncbi:MAG: TIGR02680 family protein [Streptosporangiaceae bacterium]|jgi:uncharacterized protein (TIGR02680 family)